MTEKIRSGLLLFAGMAMILSSVGGCASRGTGAGGATPREIQQPYSDSLKLIPLESPDESHVTGVIVAAGVLLFVAFLAWANAMSHATGN